MRIRSVKPGFYSDEDLNDLSLEAHFLFGGLFGLADCEGRLEDKPRTIKVSIFPHRDKITAEVVNGFLEELTKKPFIMRYSGPDEKRYIQVITFKKHQRLSGKEAESESLIPPPPGWEAMVKQEGSDGEAVNVQEGKGREEEGKRKGKEGIIIPQDLKANEAEILNWLAYKRERGQTYKGERGLAALWAKLRGIPAPLRKASIEQSMANNWSGIFQVKGEFDGKTKSAGAPSPIAGKYSSVG